MNHAFDYCKTPDEVTKQELINCIHECLCQLGRMAVEDKNLFVDNQPALIRAGDCLKKAGHIGFTK